MADSRAAGIFAALRTAARVSQERYLVHAAAAQERRRVSGNLAAEGAVTDVASLRDAVDRMAQSPFELVLLDHDEEAGDLDVLAVGRELRPLADLVLLCAPEPARVADALARGAAAVLPRPLPDSDALLRAHLRWLAAARRSRTRGLLIQSTLERHRAELEALEPALAAALRALVEEGARAPIVTVIGDAELVRAAGASPGTSDADAVVIGVAAADQIEARLGEARAHATGAAIVVVDAAATAERARAALFGGARAYVDRSQTDALGRVLALTAARRHAEVVGRKLVEALARFGVFDDDRAAPAPPMDLDARLIADATAKGGAFVPSGHEVLVVDDEVVVLTVLREALRRGGYRVTTAASAEEAIELLRRRRFDLVLTDKNLPGASGLDVLRVARTLEHAPAVVLITGYSSYDSAVEALDIGALDYIEKPIKDVELLRQRIRRALSRRDEQLSRTPPPTSEPPARGRVLVVEVEGGRRQLLAEFLGRSYDVVAVADGDEALAQLKQQRFDVVLADRNLPGMSGLRVIEQAQRLLPHCASVLYTAYPSFESVKEAFELGVDAFLVRPSEDLRALGEKLAGALRSRGGILLG